jgi:hypothetical protein
MGDGFSLAIVLRYVTASSRWGLFLIVFYSPIFALAPERDALLGKKLRIFSEIGDRACASYLFSNNIIISSGSRISLRRPRASRLELGPRRSNLPPRAREAHR